LAAYGRPQPESKLLILLENLSGAAIAQNGLTMRRVILIFCAVGCSKPPPEMMAPPPMVMAVESKAIITGSSCGDIGKRTVCKTENRSDGDHSFAESCPGGKMQRKDCTALARTCQGDSKTGVASCVDTGIQPKTCEGGIDAAGKCDGATVVRCNQTQGTIFMEDCTGRPDLFTACCPGSNGSGAECCPPANQVNPECATLGTDGMCQGNVARYCNVAGTQVFEDKCGTGDNANFPVCQMNGCQPGAYCCPASTPPVTTPTDMPDMLTPADNCGDIPYSGVCNGSVILICDSGQVQSWDCSLQSFQTQCCTDPIFGGASCCD
jgi:hypothetical protein